jgi:hypothetical protein
MAKPRSSPVRAADKESLQNTADLISKRVLEVAVTPAKDRALELARLVLGNEPTFGGREMRDEQIVKLLEAEKIGLPTFKKALSIARRELVKKPAGPLQAKLPGRHRSARPPVAPLGPRENHGVATDLDRRLL